MAKSKVIKKPIRPIAKVTKRPAKRPDTVVAPPDKQTITVNADLFRLAAMCSDTSSGRRWYLEGVYCDPHHDKGVQLVATDGHRLVVIHDEDGQASRPAIIKLNKDLLRACRPTKSVPARTLVVHLDTGVAEISDIGIKDFKGRKDIIVNMPARQEAAELKDAEFPDYRHVVPDDMDKSPRAAAAFNHEYLTTFGKIGDGLRDDGGVSMIVHSISDHSPALVRWNLVAHAFGVLMPVRLHDADAQAGRKPAFFGLPGAKAKERERTKDRTPDVLPPAPDGNRPKKVVDPDAVARKAEETRIKNQLSKIRRERAGS